MSSEKISSWISQKAKEAGAKGVVVGLSGGIDSSVVAVLSKKAAGNNMLGVIMPCNSNPADMEHAKALAKKFGIKTQTVDLAPMYDMLLKTLPQGNSIAKANVKPRLRMLTLYYFANSLGYIVAGTDNRTESFTGYFTKYGDGGVDILPISHLLKREVRKLAAELGVPKEIIDKPPSAGLWDGQTDEKEMGITYDQLDSIIEGMATGNTKGIDPKLVEKVKRMHAATEHKRRLPPAFPD
jgi:NAD+ synthase